MLLCSNRTDALDNIPFSELIVLYCILDLIVQIGTFCVNLKNDEIASVCFNILTNLFNSKIRHFDKDFQKNKSPRQTGAFKYITAVDKWGYGPKAAAAFL